MLSSVDLPLPDGPEQDDELALEQIEIDAAQGVHVDLAHVVDLGDPAGDEDGGPISQLPGGNFPKSPRLKFWAFPILAVLAISAIFGQFRYLGYPALVLTSSICAVCRALCAERKRTH